MALRLPASEIKLYYLPFTQGLFDLIIEASNLPTSLTEQFQQGADWYFKIGQHSTEVMDCLAI